MSQLKRFRVKDSNYQEVAAKFDTTEECYHFIKNGGSISNPIGLQVTNELMVEDVQEDIQVSGNEFVRVFDEGECPGDLDFF